MWSVGLEQLGPQLGFDLFGSEGMGYGLEVTGQEVLFLPMEDIDQLGVFFVQGGVGDGSAVGVDRHRDACFINAVDRVLVDRGVNVRLDIAGRADLE